MTDVRACKKCGNEFERPFGTNRMHCYTCSPARITGHDASGSVSPIRPGAPVDPDTYVPPPAPDGPHEPGRTERVVLAELERLDSLETVDGVLAIGFAAALDDQWLPGAQRTSMAKQLQVILEGIRAMVPGKLDEVDAYADVARRLREQAV
jgi:hypothetical protein